MVDDQDPVAEPLDVGQVVGREQHGRAALGALPHAGSARSRSLLSDVQADGRLVEHQQLGGVQQRGGDLAAHPLAERQLAHRGVEERLHLEQLARTRRSRGCQRRRRQPVDGAEQPERVAQRQVPPQLAALAEDHADPAGQRRALRGPARGRTTRTVPEVGTRMPVSILMVVDLPAPLAPM